MYFLRGQPNKEHAVGYCHNPKHMGYISENLLKRHKCLAKQCKYLHKYEDSPYWIERERKRAEKKARKKRG